MGKTLTGTLTFLAIGSRAWRRNEYKNVLPSEIHNSSESKSTEGLQRPSKRLHIIALSKVQSITFYHA